MDRIKEGVHGQGIIGILNINQSERLEYAKKQSCKDMAASSTILSSLQ